MALSESVFKRIRLFFDKKPASKPYIKFSIVLTIFLLYSLFSLHKFGLKDGLAVSLLTWTFFVLCTPIADGGFILDLPVRLLTGIRMIYSEMIVWIIAIVTNIILFFSNSAVYESTRLLSLFHHILSQPFPFWFIIFLSASGSFLSLIFGDELIDMARERKKKPELQQKQKHMFRLIIIATIFIIILAIYDFLLHKLGVNIKIF